MLLAVRVVAEVVALDFALTRLHPTLELVTPTGGKPETKTATLASFASTTTVLIAVGVVAPTEGQVVVCHKLESVHLVGREPPVAKEAVQEAEEKHQPHSE